jgi:drug/metabolite transporter (DMT)-like permease
MARLVPVHLSPARLGAVASIVAGLAFAVPPVLGQLALDRGASITALLGWRYAIAAVVLGILARRRLRAVPLRVAAMAAVLGAGLYTADAALFYAALDRTSAPFATLLHYVHLVVVVGVAAMVGRERLDVRRGLALAGVVGGVALVGGGGGADAVGLALALASAAAYSGYILASDRLLRDTDPLAFATYLLGGSAVAFCAFGLSTGQLASIGGSTGIAAAVVGAIVGSVLAVTAFLAGIRLAGPGTASLLVTVEVPAGLVLAALVLGAHLGGVQLAGAGVVLAAVGLLQLRIRRPRGRLAAVVPLPVSASGGEPDALAA